MGIAMGVAAVDEKYVPWLVLTAIYICPSRTEPNMRPRNGQRESRSKTRTLAI